MFHDKINDFIIVAGNSSSDDYVMNNNSHGFVYALDIESNWMWGMYFIYDTMHITTISGCILDDDGNGVFLGLANKKPIILVLDLKSGKPILFLLVETGIDKISSL